MTSAQRPIQTLVFPNQFTLIHEPSPSSLSVAYHFLIQAGSAHEPASLSGVSHFIEHMVFKGTSDPEGASWNDRVEQLGGVVNAFTSFEETSFQLAISRRHWEEGLRILLEMTLHPRLDEEDMENERGVILEEMAEGKDSADYLLSEGLWASLYGDHGYGRPVIGEHASVSGLDRNSLKGYYEKAYQPPRMILAVAGAVEWNELREVVAGVLGEKKWPEASFPSIVDLQLSDPSTVRVQRGKHERVLEMAYAVPEVQHPDTPTLDLLSVILGDGEMSRLYRVLRLEKEMVRSVGTSIFSQSQTGLFLIRALLKEDQGKACLEEIVGQIKKLKDEGVSGAELSRAKLLMDKELCFNTETLEGRARTLAYFHHAFGSAEFERNYRKNLLAVTEDDIRHAAEVYLNGERVTLAVLTPQNEPGPSDEEFREIMVPVQSLPRSQAGSQESDVVRWNLDNQMRVVFRRVPGSPVSGVYALAKGGLRSETADINGVSCLMAATVDRGTRGRTHEEIAQGQLEHQADLGGFVGQSSQGARMESVRSSFLEALNLFGEVLLHPSFPEAVVEQERTMLLQELRVQDDYFEVMASNLFTQTLLSDHPYGLNMLGNLTSLPKLNSKELRERQEFLIQPRELVLGVVGDHDLAELQDRLQHLWGDIPNVGSAYALEPHPIKLAQMKEVKRPIHGEKTYLSYGFLGPARSAPGRYGMEVLASILSSSGGGRLYERLREERGLVYSVDCMLFCGMDTGFLAISLNTSPKFAQEAYQEVRSELERLKVDPVSEEELTRVKNYLSGVYELDLQRSSSQAAMLSSGELFGDERNLEDYPERIRQVTAEDVQEAARTYLLLDRSTLIWLSPEIN